ncbi:endonuclease-3 [Methanocalculus alkaliphilus]|uniref:endonuclease III n=1 Tax=Methanocalculus alkaliphilus TaxID=768730 RepID=UPI00209F1B18|nr:endonuclease III [Methanocalculus alkaliphilus]MCP1715891.1 endonuclease-3 [Methanocalculus alkaliphilus]
MDSTTALLIYHRLFVIYPHTETHFLGFTNAFECLILTILSAQTTDATVNRIAPALFERYPTAEDLAAADTAELEEIIRPTGFYHAKGKNIIGAAAALIARYDGAVPDQMEELVTLPGVGRKTANIVLHHAFGINAGVAVDTHVRRLSQRIGLSETADPEKIERDLMTLYPQDLWGEITYLLIRHGREVCSARKPACPTCVIQDLCAYIRSEK